MLPTTCIILISRFDAVCRAIAVAQMTKAPSKSTDEETKVSPDPDPNPQPEPEPEPLTLRQTKMLEGEP